MFGHWQKICGRHPSHEKTPCTRTSHQMMICTVFAKIAWSRMFCCNSFSADLLSLVFDFYILGVALLYIYFLTCNLLVISYMRQEPLRMTAPTPYASSNYSETLLTDTPQQRTPMHDAPQFWRFWPPHCSVQHFTLPIVHKQYSVELQPSRETLLCWELTSGIGLRRLPHTFGFSALTLEPSSATVPSLVCRLTNH